MHVCPIWCWTRASCRLQPQHSTVCIPCILQPTKLRCGVGSEEVSVGHTHSVTNGTGLIPKCQFSTAVACCSFVLTKAGRHAARFKEEEDVQGKDEEPTTVSLSAYSVPAPAHLEYLELLQCSKCNVIVVARDQVVGRVLGCLMCGGVA